MDTFQPQNMLQTTERIFENLFKKSKRVVSWSWKKLELEESYSLLGKERQGQPYVMMGEIYYAHLGTNLGSEIDKERPVLIFQNNDSFIKQSNMAIVIPISSNSSNRPYRVQIAPTDVVDNKGVTDGMILIQQIRSISKARLSQLKGRLSDVKLKEVFAEVNKIFYKSTPLFLKEGDAQVVKE